MHIVVVGGRVVDEHREAIWLPYNALGKGSLEQYPIWARLCLHHQTTAYGSRPKMATRYVWIGARGTEVNAAGLSQGLVDQGYLIGRDVVIEDRYADGYAERVPALIAELLALKVDILATPGTPITRAAQRATSTVPIVCVTVNPIKFGLVASLSQPGGNITGLELVDSDYGERSLQLLQEVAPKLRRIAVLRNPDNPLIAREIERLHEEARVLGVDLTVFSVRPTDREVNLNAIANAGFGGLVVTTDYSLEPLAARIITFTAERRLPAIYPFITATEQGGLISYSADYFAIWRHAASYVDRIFRGARPAEQAADLALKVNLKTAKALGHNLPPTLVAGADQVIE
jgi:putative ABC transport system substrate-binding protein